MNSSTSTQTNTSELKQYPTISGCQNQSALGKVIPFILGKTFFTPNYIGNPYTSISGKDGQTNTFHCCYLLGYSDLRVRDIKLGTKLLASNGNDNSINALVDNGTITIDGEYSTEKYGTKLELQQGENEVSLYPQKVVQTDYGKQLINTPTSTITTNENGIKRGGSDDNNRLSVYGFSAKYPHKVQVQIQLDGLINYDSSSNPVTEEEEIGVQMSVDGGNTWLPFVAFTHDNTDLVFVDKGEKTVTIEGEETKCYATLIKGKKNEVMRFIAEKTFSYEEAKNIKNNVVELRIFKISVDNHVIDSNCSDTVYLEKITTWCYNPRKSKKQNTIVPQELMIAKKRNVTARLGFEIQSSNTLKSTLNFLSVVATSKGRIWNSETRTWSTELVPTVNPASVALLSLQGNVRGSKPYPDSKIDYEGFGTFYEWCNKKLSDGEARYQVRGAVTRSFKSSQLVNQILYNGHGCLQLIGKKYTVFIDAPRTDDMTTSGELLPVMILNSQNVLSASNAKTFDDLPDGFRINFTNALLDNQSDSFDMILNDEVEEDEAELMQLDLPYTHEVERAKRTALYEYAKLKYRPELFNRRVFSEGYLIEVGDLVEVQDDTISVGIGEGGEILEIKQSNGYVTGFITDGLFNVTDLNNEYGIKINKATYTNGKYDSTVLTLQVIPNATGMVNEFTLKTPLLIRNNLVPEEGDVFSFGYYESISTYTICTSKKSDSNGYFDLSLLPYSNNVYEAEEGADLYDYVSNVTPVSDVPTEISEYVSKNEFGEQKSALSSSIYENTPLVLNYQQSFTVPTSPYGVIGEGVLENTVKTKIQCMRGNIDVTDDCVFSIVTSANITGYFDSSVKGLLVCTSLDEDTATLSFTVKYGANIYTGSINVTKAKQGLEGTDFLVDLSPENTMTSANPDGTVKENTVSTQVIMSYESETIDTSLYLLTFKKGNLVLILDDVIQPAYFNLVSLEQDSVKKRITVSSELIDTAYTTTSFDVECKINVTSFALENESTQRTRYAVWTVLKYTGASFLDFELDHTSIKVDQNGEYKPKEITPTIYSVTESGKYITDEGFVTIQEYNGNEPIGELRACGYQEAGDEYKEEVNYKSKVQPMVAYSYNDDGTVDHSSVMGELIDNQVVAWVFYDRIKE